MVIFVFVSVFGKSIVCVCTNTYKIYLQLPRSSLEAKSPRRFSPLAFELKLFMEWSTTKEHIKKGIVNQAKSGWNGIKVRSWIPKLPRLKSLSGWKGGERCVWDWQWPNLYVEHLNKGRASIPHFCLFLSPRIFRSEKFLWKVNESYKQE